MSGGTKWMTADTTASERESISSHAGWLYMNISHLDEAGPHAQALPRKRLQRGRFARAGSATHTATITIGATNPADAGPLALALKSYALEQTHDACCQ